MTLETGFQSDGIVSEIKSLLKNLNTSYEGLLIFNNDISHMICYMIYDVIYDI